MGNSIKARPGQAKTHTVLTKPLGYYSEKVEDENLNSRDIVIDDLGTFPFLALSLILSMLSTHMQNDLSDRLVGFSTPII